MHSYDRLVEETDEERQARLLDLRIRRLVEETDEIYLSYECARLIVSPAFPCQSHDVLCHATPHASWSGPSRQFQLKIRFSYDSSYHSI